MIITSYTRLVMESHRERCGNAFSGVSRRLRANSAGNETRRPLRSYEPIAVRLAQPLAGEVSEMATGMQSKVTSAA